MAAQIVVVGEVDMSQGVTELELRNCGNQGSLFGSASLSRKASCNVLVGLVGAVEQVGVG